MSAITDFLYSVLTWINGIVNNYGISIIIFTTLIRLVCMPFDYRSRKGMRKMSLIQPKLNELQKKYANDREKLQRKQSELMRKEGYNPLSGCLPMLLTWPLMIAMFAAMRAIANEQMAVQVFRYLAGEEHVITAADSFLWVKNIWITDSLFKSIAPTADNLRMLTADVWQKALAQFESNPAALAAIEASLKNAVEGAALDFSSNAAMQTTVASIDAALKTMPAYNAAIATVPGWSGMNFFLFSISLYQNYNGLLILPILAGLSQVLSAKFNPQMQEQATGQPSGQQNSMGNFMKYFFPILSVWFCLTSNAGFAVYWVTSTCVMWLQGVLINKMLEKQDEKKAQSVSGEGTVK
ncbi:MAG: YidC/Oxa1 family membrane protein insertase [Clostridiales bacterium]|nr:YidC/Oxa1 family membrane protein insertase [Clostridiales bacterium]